MRENGFRTFASLYLIFGNGLERTVLVYGSKFTRGTMVKSAGFSSSSGFINSFPSPKFMLAKIMNENLRKF